MQSHCRIYLSRYIKRRNGGIYYRHYHRAGSLFSPLTAGIIAAYKNMPLAFLTGYEIISNKQFDS